jgi:hypothetical protein
MATKRIKSPAQADADPAAAQPADRVLADVLEHVHSAEPGERVTVVFDGQTYVAWREADGTVHAENRGA